MDPVPSLGVPQHWYLFEMNKTHPKQLSGICHLGNLQSNQLNTMDTKTFNLYSKPSCQSLSKALEISQKIK